MNNEILAPIVLFVYNRPWHTQQTVEALQKNKLVSESNLFIFSDAPKDDTAWENVAKVRKYIHQIRGFKSVKVIEREQHFGLAKSVITGVTDVVNQYGKIIVLEDDLVVSLFFLQYMNDALNKYADNAQVMQVSGYMFPVEIHAPSDAVLLPLTTTWGWGTWRRAWKNFDTSMKGYEILKKDKKLRDTFNLKGKYNYFRILEDKRKNKNSSWGILWYLTVFNEKGLVVYPIRTLVQNIGFDGSGTHCKAETMRQNDLYVHEIEKFPDNIQVNKEIYDMFIDDFEVANKSPFKKIVNKLRKCFLSKCG